MLSEREITIKIEEKARDIAKALYKGKSVEINKVNKDTIKFSEVKKEAIQ